MNYTFVKNIGQGGFGKVDEVIGDDGVHYAMKTFNIHPSYTFDSKTIENLKKRFSKEARIQKSISHRHIVPVLDENLTGQTPFFIMPLASNSLADDFQNKAVDSSNFLDIYHDILNGIEEIHSLGILHRDLKLQNVLKFIEPKSGKFYYAVSDFGFISLNETKFTSLTQTGMAKGTDWYTAPEVTQDLRHATKQSDIYSLGCILHDFVGTNSRVPCNEIHDSGEFGSLLLACTRNDSKRRFKSVSTLRDALATIGSTSVQLKSDIGKHILTLIEKEDDYTEVEVTQIADFLQNEQNTDDYHTVMMNLNLRCIEKLVKVLPQGPSIGKSYAKFVRENSFRWDDCDTLANRLELFIESGEIDVQSDCIMALLYMGTRHNRWYVERKFVNYTISANDNLTKRLCIEIRVDDLDACRAFEHLEYSINFPRTNFQQPIKKTLEEICN